jgi:DNA-binding winged helix-turn-helix (wHTH) protein/TolB-like protein
MRRQTKHFYEFGPFRLDPWERRLLLDGAVVPLTAKVFDTLLVLVQNSGQTLEKEELLQKVWPDTFVEEGNLPQNISVLRKALGDSASDTRYIETIPRRGYRFIADVRKSYGQPEPQGRRLRLVVALLAAIGIAGTGLLWIWSRFERKDTAPIRSLAVLPFRTLQPGSAEDTLGLGIADGVITRISQVGALTIRPTGAIRKYVSRPDDPLTTARELRVDSVLEGTFQRAGGRLRVSVNLLRTRDGASLWAESFDVPVTGFFAVQDDVCRQIVARLRLSLTAAEQDRLGRRATSSTEAYEYYLKGMNAFDNLRKGSGAKPALESASALLQRAIEIDPDYALARAQLASAYVRIGTVVDLEDPSWIQLAEEQLRRAQALDPLLAEVHVVRNWILCSGYGGFNIEEAARELELAKRLNPSVGRSELGVQYAHLGLEELAVRELEKSIEIDPVSEVRQVFLGEGYRLLGRIDEAIAHHMKFWNRPGPVRALIDRKRLEEAEPMISRNLALNPDGPYEIGARALSFALRGKFAEAEALIPPALKLRNNPSYHHATHNFAAVYALQGKTHLALKWLRETVETGMPSYLLFLRDSNFNAIRRDPAFIRFMGELRIRWEGYKRDFQ